MAQIFRVGPYKPIKKPVASKPAVEKKSTQETALINPILFRPWLVNLSYKQSLPAITDHQVQRVIQGNPDVAKRLVRDIWQRFFELGEIVPTEITCESIRVDLKALADVDNNAVEVIIGGRYQLVGEVLEKQVGLSHKPFNTWVSKALTVEQVFKCLQRAGLAGIVPGSIWSRSHANKRRITRQRCLIDLYRKHSYRLLPMLSCPLLLLIPFWSNASLIVLTQLLIYVGLGIRVLFLNHWLKHFQTVRQSRSRTILCHLLGLSQCLFKLACLDLEETKEQHLDILTVQDAIQQQSSAYVYRSLPADYEHELDVMLTLDSNGNLPSLSNRDIAMLLKISAQVTCREEALAYRARAGQEMLVRLKRDGLPLLSQYFHVHDLFVAMAALKKQAFLSHDSAMDIMGMRDLTDQDLDEVLLKLTIQVAMLRPRLARLFPVPGKQSYGQDTQLLRQALIKKLGPMIYDSIFCRDQSELLDDTVAAKRFSSRSMVMLTKVDQVAGLLDAFIDLKKPLTVSQLVDWTLRNRQFLAKEDAFCSLVESLDNRINPGQHAIPVEQLLIRLSQMLLSARLCQDQRGSGLLALLSNSQWFSLLMTVEQQDSAGKYAVSDQTMAEMVQIFNHVHAVMPSDREWLAIAHLAVHFFEKRETAQANQLLKGLKYLWPVSQWAVLSDLVNQHNNRVVTRWTDWFTTRPNHINTLTTGHVKPRSSGSTNYR